MTPKNQLQQPVCRPSLSGSGSESAEEVDHSQAAYFMSNNLSKAGAKCSDWSQLAEGERKKKKRKKSSVPVPVGPESIRLLDGMVTLSGTLGSSADVTAVQPAAYLRHHHYPAAFLEVNRGGVTACNADVTSVTWHQNNVRDYGRITADTENFPCFLLFCVFFAPHNSLQVLLLATSLGEVVEVQHLVSCKQLCLHNRELHLFNFLITRLTV